MCKNEPAGRADDSEGLIPGCLQMNRRRCCSQSQLHNAASALWQLSRLLLTGAAPFQGVAVSSGCDASLHPCTLIFTANNRPPRLVVTMTATRLAPTEDAVFLVSEKGIFSFACESRQSTDGVGRSVCVCLLLGSRWGGGGAL